MRKNAPKEPEYPLTKGEIKYKIFMNLADPKFEEIRQKIKDNNGYCPNAKEKTNDTKCMCQDFLLLDKENMNCKCGLYFKKARTEEEIKKFITTKKTFTSKNEKKILNEKIEDENFMDTNIDDTGDDN